MIEYDITPKILAKRMAVSRDTVYMWLRGDYTPNLEYAIAIADIFEVSLDRLCGRKEFIK